MRIVRVVFSPEARDDLLGLYDYIADRAGEDLALRYIERIEVYCRRFETFPERGTKRDDIRHGLRIVGFERRVTIAFHCDADATIIDRILYGGRNLDVVLS